MRVLIAVVYLVISMILVGCSGVHYEEDRNVMGGTPYYRNYDRGIYVGPHTRTVERAWPKQKPPPVNRRYKN